MITPPMQTLKYADEKLREELQEEFDRKVTMIKTENPGLEKAIQKAVFISSIITNMVDAI